MKIRYTERMKNKSLDDYANELIEEGDENGSKD